jgi:GNAT superfamily N-acetyltransferase
MALERVARNARMVEDAWAAAWASLGATSSTPRTVVDDLPDYLRVYTPGAPELLLNLVMRYATPGPVTREAVEQIIAPFRRNRLPFQWWLTAGMEPSGLRERLRSLGMQSWGGSTSMTLELANWQPAYSAPPAEVQLLRATTPDANADALRIICDIFFLPWEATARWATANPAFAVYLACWSDRPVAALTTMRHGDAILVFNVATAPGARRRGIAGNLVIRSLRDAQAEGCAQAALTATPEARRLYEALSFRACGVMEQWAPGYRFQQALTQGAQTTRHPVGGK